MLCKGEKTSVFWAGLLIVSFASWVVFASIWSELQFANWWDAIIHYSLPFIIGAVIFIPIGLVMMKSGAKKEAPPTQK
jgi:ABC-type dipeptide/oligopeptide/nickel transport system permease component